MVILETQLYEQALVIRSQLGDEAAFAELLSLHGPRILRFTRQMMANFRMLREMSQSSEHGPHLEPKEAEGMRDAMLSLSMTTNWAVAFCTAWIADSVALLGMGSLVTVTFVLVQRRVTLQQININLAKISDQLRALETTPTSSTKGVSS